MKHRICDTCSKKLKHTVELSFFQSIIHRLKGHKIYKTEFYEYQFKQPPISIPKTYVPKAGRQAIHQDIGKFFKGKSKHQHKTYRRSVKRKVKPEDN